MFTHCKLPASTSVIRICMSGCRPQDASAKASNPTHGANPYSFSEFKTMRANITLSALLSRGRQCFMTLLLRESRCPTSERYQQATCYQDPLSCLLLPPKHFLELKLFPYFASFLPALHFLRFFVYASHFLSHVIQPRVGSSSNICVSGRRQVLHRYVRLSHSGQDFLDISCGRKDASVVPDRFEAIASMIASSSDSLSCPNKFSISHATIELMRLQQDSHLSEIQWQKDARGPRPTTTVSCLALVEFLRALGALRMTVTMAASSHTDFYPQRHTFGPTVEFDRHHFHLGTRHHFHLVSRHHFHLVELPTSVVPMLRVLFTLCSRGPTRT
jgi:hypothetical protein